MNWYGFWDSLGMEIQSPELMMACGWYDEVGEELRV